MTGSTLRGEKSTVAGSIVSERSAEPAYSSGCWSTVAGSTVSGSSGPAGSGCLKSWAVTGPKGDHETDELPRDLRGKV